MKITKILLSLALMFSIGMAVAPQQADAFTLFGIRFFEGDPEPTPTPTPTPEPTPTPTPSMTQLVDEDDQGQVLSDQDNLPSTGPRENMAMIIGGVAAAFIAHKYWRGHQG